MGIVPVVAFSSIKCGLAVVVREMARHDGYGSIASRTRFSRSDGVVNRDDHSRENDAVKPAVSADSSSERTQQWRDTHRDTR